MPLSATSLEALIDTKLQAAGFDLVAGEAGEMAKAIAEAVVEHITANAQVVVAGGSSAGTYSVT